MLTENALYYIENRAASKALKPILNASGSGVVIASKGITPSNAFLWRAETAQVGQPYWKLKNEATGLYLTLPATATGTQPIISASGDQWTEIGSLGGYSYIRFTSTPGDRVGVSATGDNSPVSLVATADTAQQTFEFIPFVAITVGIPTIPARIFKNQTTVSVGNVTPGATVRLYKNNVFLDGVTQAGSSSVAVNVTALQSGDKIKVRQEYNGTISEYSTEITVMSGGKVWQSALTQWRAYDMVVTDSEPCNDIQQWQGTRGTALGPTRSTYAEALADLESFYTLTTNPFCTGTPTPVVPTLTATAVTSTSVLLAWGYIGTALGFQVQRSTDNSTWTSIFGSPFGATVRNVTATGLTTDTLYYFRVRVLYADSNYSEWVSATATPTGVSAPSDVTPKTIMHGFGEVKGSAYNEAVSAGGVNVVTVKVRWSQVERGLDNWKFGEIDYIMETVNADQLRLIIQLEPFHVYPDAISNETAHDKVNNVFVSTTYEAKSVSYLPLNCFDRDRYGRLSNEGGDLGVKGLFSYNNAYARARYLQFVARVVDYANNHPLKGIIEGFFYIDGDFGETCISRQFSYNTNNGIWPVNTDLGYSDDEMAGFRSFLQGVYGTIGSLNSAWGINYADFSQINKDTIPRPPTDGTFFNYNYNQGTRDLFAFRVKTRNEMYSDVTAAIKNPSDYLAGLSSGTGFKTFAYNTENFTWNEGVSTATAMMKYMYQPFDCLISSCTAGGGPTNTAGYLGDLVLRQQLYRGTFGEDKDYGFEMDLDPVENSFGPSKTMSVLKPLGCKYVMIALADVVEKWNRNVTGSDGATRTLKADLKRCRDLYCDGQTVSFPSYSSVIEYTDSDVLNSPHDPDGKKSAWITASGLNAATGVMTTNVLLRNTANFVP